MQINKGREHSFFYPVFLQGRILTLLLIESLEANGYQIAWWNMVSDGE